MEDVASVWLVPAQEDKVYLQGIIDDLSRRYDCPIFTPHMTIYACSKRASLSLTEQAVSEAVWNFKPFSVTMSGLSYLDDFFKTVFITLQDHPVAQAIYEKLKNKLNRYGSYTFLPHISLMYKTMPSLLKEEIIKNLSLKKSFLIDSIAISTPGSELGWHAISDWKIAYQQKIG